MWLNASLKNIHHGDTIIVANKRQIIAFKNSYTKCQKNTVWQMPAIFTWSQFFIHCHQKIADAPIVINAFNQQMLWQQIIAEKQPKYSQNQIKNLSQKALTDYQTMHRYAIAAERKMLTGNFYHWLKSYQTRLKENHWIDIEQLPTLILSHPNVLPKRLLVYGFNYHTPQQQHFFEKTKHTILPYQNSEKKPINTLTFTTLDDELSDCVHWLKPLAGKTQSIAIIANNLTAIKSTLKIIFNNHLMRDDSPNYNISLGDPFIKLPYVQLALTAIEFCHQCQQQTVVLVETITNILHSPLIRHYQAEKNDRAHLAQQTGLSIQAADIKAHCPQLHQLLKTLPNSNWQNKNPQQWALFWLKLLTHLGLFDDSSDEKLRSQQNKLRQSLTQFCQLQLLAKNSSFPDAFKQFKQLLEQQIYQAPLPPTNIHVMGLLEAQGLRFDQVRFINFNQTTLTFIGSPIYFIKLALAKKYQIPSADGAIRQTLAENFINHLKQCAEQLYFSYAKNNLNQHYQASLLIDFSLAVSPDKIVAKTNKPLAVFSDSKASAIKKKTIKNGITVLKDQTICPFKGFSHRLNVATIEKTGVAFNKMEKGSIIHRVLESIYQTHNNSVKIKASANNKADINWHIQNQLKKSNKAAIWQTLEQRRIASIITRFLGQESQRNDFETIAVEVKKNININGLDFSIRIDRIDKISDKYLLIDYKSGKNTATINHINKTPLVELQLPVYALSTDASALALITVNSAETKYQSLGEMAVFSKHTDSNWQQQKAQWQQILNNISQDFQQGVATVAPLKDNCQHCDKTPLCRINYVE